MRTVRISFDHLAALPPGKNLRQPLKALETAGCVHGELRLEVAGRVVPSMGYFGREDVCFGAWLRELRDLAVVMRALTGKHVYDEGEQGQPAFVFECVGETAFFTIADSEYSDGTADSDWRRVEFRTADFIEAEAGFQRSFIEALRTETPQVADVWLKGRGL